MNHPLHIARRYDPAIDKALRDIEFERDARESDQAAQHACEALTALACYVGMIVLVVVAVTA